ncbi:Serine/threonine protein kinase [Actinacidiphila yanglinensis]|uniref:non-specific serine/threonine protein kinase n=1 Tax=Actinacidiphila yanglinensis TaxID=310779 RepID=A0A1H6DC52_9ACTN|nr:serine/threonine-protein kinase [Actinacidiphila yanglinensis]SEG82393.1 Serine/threonine protein kinase [Actinacidiphila yanglinensis]
MRDQMLGGRYRLVRQLGEGGMGQVWEAEDETLSRNVAVKVISLLAGGGSRGDEARTRFLREARITAQLQHPHIVTIHDLGETDAGIARVPFLVMELVRGEGLDTALRRGVVTLADAARWGAQISDALAVAHAAGIMHRDIKPSNILITPSGTVKVLDFGIARAADPYATADRITQTGFIVGTPPYMAPEQARGLPEPRSDLYALGCLLFELITGQLPFQAPDTVGYLTAHLTQEPPTPSSVSTGVPSAWDDLVLRLLEKDPDQRYPSATDLSQALRRLDRTPEPAGDPAPSTGETSEATRKPDKKDIPFTISWTGKDPLSAYTDSSHKGSLVVFAKVLLLVTAPGVLIPLLLHRIKAGTVNNGWLAWFALSTGIGILPLGFLLVVPLLTYLHRSRQAWSLSVGPEYIETTGHSGTRKYLWRQVLECTIEEIVTNLWVLHEFTGLHLKFTKDVKRKRGTDPAGWPPNCPGERTIRGDGVWPICVLGPMTDKQRSELSEAIARYGPPR